MPTSVPLAAFIFGAILFMMALLGGEFQLFGAHIRSSLGKPTRIICAILSAIFLSIAIFDPFAKVTNPSPPQVIATTSQASAIPTETPSTPTDAPATPRPIPDSPTPKLAATPELPTTSLPTVIPVEVEQQLIRNVIYSEAKGYIEHDLTLLESVWTSDGAIIEKNKTPDYPSDDNYVRGWPALKERYIEIFPKSPKSIEYVDLKISVSGNEATAVNRGSVQDGVYTRDTAVFQLRKIDGKWRIAQYEYGNE